MNVEEAKKICPDFLPIQKEGKLRCRYKSGEEMCSHAKHFVCELVMFQRGERGKELANPEQPESSAILVAHPRIGLPVISASRVGLLEKCPRLYYLNYILRVKPPYEAAWKRVGTAFTEQRAAIDESKPWSLDKYKDLTDVEATKLFVVLTGYEKHVRPKLPEKLICETQVKFDHNGASFVGYLDAETEDSKTIYEWKYAQGSYDNLKIARQSAVYFHGRPQADTFIVAVAKKPTHKPKKASKPTKKEPNPVDETIPMFRERLLAEMNEDWFDLRAITRREIDPVTVLDQMANSMGLLPAIAEAAFPPHYSMECDNCEFKYLCEEHLTRNIGCDKSMCKTRALCTQIDNSRTLLGKEPR